MSTPQDDEAIRALFTEAQYIDDDGFTDRVMAELPAKPRPHLLRRAILAASVLAACIIGFVVFPGASYLLNATFEVTELSRNAIGIPIASWVIVAMTTLGALAAATSE